MTREGRQKPEAMKPLSSSFGEREELARKAIRGKLEVEQRV